MAAKDWIYTPFDVCIIRSPVLYQPAKSKYIIYDRHVYEQTFRQSFNYQATYNTLLIALPLLVRAVRAVKKLLFWYNK